MKQCSQSHTSVSAFALQRIPNAPRNRASEKITKIFGNVNKNKKKSVKMVEQGAEGEPKRAKCLPNLVLAVPETEPNCMQK